MENTPEHYSYSRLNQVNDCPYSYFLEKIEKVDTVQNGFAQLGTLYHSILEKWGKGTLAKDKMTEEYKKRYPSEVIVPWPKVLASKGYADKAYNQGIDYFDNFDGFPGYEVLAVELEFETEIAGRKFVGYIDMLLKEIDTGKLVVLDHKSKSLKEFKKCENDMYRQQLLYSKYIYEKYGRYPDVLMFNLFKEGGLLMSKPFDKNEYDEAIKWAEKQIEKIESNTMIDWLVMKDQDFFCMNICSCRFQCPNGKYKK